MMEGSGPAEVHAWLLNGELRWNSVIVRTPVMTMPPPLLRREDYHPGTG